VPEDDLALWEARLDAAEADLRERELRALDGEPTPAETVAFAAEHEKLAADRDSVADAYDELAHRRDIAGFGRDVRASQRDLASRSSDGSATDRASMDRIISGIDRDLAAGDRADSGDDRKRASRARRQAADDRQHARDGTDADHDKVDADRQMISGLTDALMTRQVIGQAEGIMMARYNLDSDAAFRMLVKLSRETDTTLRDVAAQLVTQRETATRHETIDERS
jgi:hypothetical protein